ncbi:DinB family protein [Longimicrobium terrae]|uniref:Putative damage-inducible protein DinB n=1 Tax=Longimicrobium terrae TaxID=1639882 RepID=A0A841GPT4_9BACT|nr:DinB family protein [Longimicrobium terrae]MBB4635008.1 putative damage-inducible protein DinB [Longimicrobium terrae]MBB6069402.1 putative damage-inducible protein DinB [Longimicrobium terrae]NNC31792.1 DinB family protein [Longimicrobium terrae]
MSTLSAIRQQAVSTHRVVNLNTDGVSHAQSLIAPKPAGNSANWVLGHLLCVYNDVLGLLGAARVMERDALKPYARGSAPLEEKDALPLDSLVDGWNRACAEFDAALASIPETRLAEPVPNSPTNNPDETVGSLLVTVMFHQAYHAGQLGLLRRVAGHAGAIA